MAVKIRLRRMGAKKRPFYRFVVADSRSPRNGRFIEEIGYYNPIIEPVEIKIKEDRAIKWLRDGAMPTDTVRGLMNRLGIIEKAKDKNYSPEEGSIIHVGAIEAKKPMPVQPKVEEAPVEDVQEPEVEESEAVEAEAEEAKEEAEE